MSHCAVVDTEFKVWVFGGNGFGQLGLGDKIDRNVPTRICGLESIISVSMGEWHTLFLDTSGFVWVSGRLGVYESTIPIKIFGIKDIIKIDSEAYYCLMLNKGGEVFSFGNSDYAQLGRENNGLPFGKPAKIGLTNIKDISAGYQHSIFLDQEGTCWTCGYNNFCQMGIDSNYEFIPTKINHLPPIRVISAGALHSNFIDEDNMLYYCGEDLVHGKSRFPMSLGVKALMVYNGLYTTIIMDMDNKPYGLGLNKSGQLGLGHKSDVLTLEKLPFYDDICSIITMCSSTIVINSTGECFGTGSNNKKCLGLGDLNETLNPMRIEGFTAIVTDRKRFLKTKNSKNYV